MMNGRKRACGLAVLLTLTVGAAPASAYRRPAVSQSGMQQLCQRWGLCFEQSVPVGKPMPTSPESAVNESVEQQVLALVNAERAKNGLSGITWNTGAAAAAQVRAQETAVQFSHTRPNGSSCFTALSEQGVSYRRAGENIAYGQPTAEAVMAAWMNSPGHRANILSESFTGLGVGRTVVNGTIYWTQMFVG